MCWHLSTAVSTTSVNSTMEPSTTTSTCLQFYIFWLFTSSVFTVYLLCVNMRTLRFLQFFFFFFLTSPTFTIDLVLVQMKILTYSHDSPDFHCWFVAFSNENLYVVSVNFLVEFSHERPDLSWVLISCVGLTSFLIVHLRVLTYLQCWFPV